MNIRAGADRVEKGIAQGGISGDNKEVFDAEDLREAKGETGRRYTVLSDSMAALSR